MRKALVPLLASLALCGAGTAALIATNARAQSSASTRKPVMVAMSTTAAPLAAMTAAPRGEGGPPPGMPGDMGARREQFCNDMVARRIGELAYFEAKLSLTAAQKPAFDHWKDATLEVAKRQADHCGARPHGQGRPTLIDHMAREEAMLKDRLADLEIERPALEGLYNTLNPQQQAELGHSIRTLLMMRGMMEDGMMDHRPMMMGMMDGHPRPHGPMGAPPPPPDGAPPADR